MLIGRKEHSIGRRHIQRKIDYYSQLLIEAHQEGNLTEVNPLFSMDMPNMQNDTIKNPFNNSVVNTSDISSLNIPGIQPSNISYLPLPGLNAAIPINPSDQMNTQQALHNLLPSNIINPGQQGMPIPNMPPNSGPSVDQQQQQQQSKTIEKSSRSNRSRNRNR